MSQENIEIVRSVFGPFEGIDVAEIDWGSEPIREILERNFSPDVELTTLESAAGSGPSRHYSGYDGLVQYLREWFEPFSEYHLELFDYIEDGERVLVPFRASAVGGASGVPVDLELTMAYELRDGRITRVGQYDTVEQAREAGSSG